MAFSKFDCRKVETHWIGEETRKIEIFLINGNVEAAKAKFQDILDRIADEESVLFPPFTDILEYPRTKIANAFFDHGYPTIGVVADTSIHELDGIPNVGMGELKAFYTWGQEHKLEFHVSWKQLESRARPHDTKYRMQAPDPTRVRNHGRADK